MSRYIPACLLLLLASGAFAAEFKTRVVDASARPLAGATVELDLEEKGADGKVISTQRLKLISDVDGWVKGSFDGKKYATNELQVSVAKAGYSGYSTGTRLEYVLQRIFGPRDLRRIARLSGDKQQAGLKELLLGEFGDEEHEGHLTDEVFPYYRELGPALRALLPDAQAGTKAAEILSFIGMPEDLRLVVQHAPPAKKELFKDRWAYHVVSALLEPSTDAEWDFLKKCALNDYDDAWVVTGAINSLRLIASPRSLEILKEVGMQNRDRQKSIAKAIDYIQSNPPPLSHTNLVEAGQAVAKAMKLGEWTGNKEPKFNDEEDMALVECEYKAGRDEYIYTATFHRVNGVWKLRGVRETMQALMAFPPARERFIGVWHGYGESHLEFARLELKEDGTGQLTISYLPDSPSQNYRVTKWTQRERALDTVVEPAEPEAEPVELKDLYLGIGSLEFELHGRGWHTKMTLFEARTLEKRAAEVKKRMEEMPKDKKP